MKRERSALWQQYDASTDKRKDEAARRLKVLDAVTTLVNSGISKIDAQERVSVEFGDHPATIRRWFKQVKAAHRSDWLPALLSSHGGGAKPTDCNPEAWDWLLADFLRLEQPPFSACYERLQRVAQQRGWMIPSERTLLRRVNSLPIELRILARQGTEALARRFPAQKRDRTGFHALEAVNADGHKFDVFVEWPDGTIGRAIGEFWQDLYSGKILSYRIDKTENRDIVRLSFGDLVERWGIPRYAWLDNGRANASKWMSGGMKHRFRFKVKEEEPLGIFTQLGIDVHWATPYHGQAKPIERAFRDFCDRISKHLAFAGHYTGNSPASKPANYNDKTGVPLETFLRVLDEEIIHHNARLGRRSDACAGVRSFDQVFEESYKVAPIRKATDAQRRLWLLAAESVTASRQDGAVYFYGNRYWSNPLGALAGEKIVVRFDPQHLQAGIHVYRPNGVYVGLAECQGAYGFNDTEAARANAHAKGDFKQATKDLLDSERRMSITDAAAMLPAPPEPIDPAARVVRPFFKHVSNDDTETALPKVASASGGQDIWNSGEIRQNIRDFREDLKRSYVPD